MNVYSLIKPIGAFFIIAGALVMLGWVADISILKTFAPGTPVTNFPTALSIFLAGIMLRSFYRLSIGEKQGDALARIMACSAVYLLVFFPLFVGYFWKIQIGLDTIFEPVIVNGVAVQSFIPSSGSIICIGTLFVMSLVVSLGFSISKISRWGGLFLVGLSALAIVGYIVGDPSLYYITGHSNGMAPRTAISFAVLGLAFIALGVRPHDDHQPVSGEDENAPA